METNQDIESFLPISLLFLPDSIASLVRALPIVLLNQDEETLATLCQPTRKQRQLKISFFEKYEVSRLAFESKQILKVEIADIINGICSEGIFKEWVLSKNFLAWFITPQCPSEIIIAELLYTGLQSLREVLQEPSHDEDGKLLTSLINTKLSIVKMLDARKNGEPVKKSEAKILQQNIPAPTSAPATASISNEEFIARMQALESTLIKRLPTTKDA